VECSRQVPTLFSVHLSFTHRQSFRKGTSTVDKGGATEVPMLPWSRRRRLDAGLALAQQVQSLGLPNKVHRNTNYCPSLSMLYTFSARARSAPSDLNASVWESCEVVAHGAVLFTAASGWVWTSTAMI
jgi:hypothetical protein